MENKAVKTLTVDWNNPVEISKLIQNLKARFCEIAPNRLSKKERHRRTMDACIKIMGTSLWHLYKDLPLSESLDYYVYAHLDTSKKIAIGVNGTTTFAATLGMEYVPFYIGKGIGNRCQDINRNETHRKVRQKLTDMGKEIKVIKLFEGLSEIEALANESKLIDIFGLIPYGGKLSNLDEGLLPQKRRALYQNEYNNLSQFNKGMSIMKKK